MAGKIGTDSTWLIGEDSNTFNSTESQPQAKTRVPRKMYLAALSALMFAVSMGMVSAYSATATEDMKQPNSGIEYPSDDEIAWIGSLVALGAAIGGLVSGYLSNAFGRKGSLLFSSIPFLFGWYCIAFATNIWPIYVGRLITGFCVGLVCVTTPAYLVEISTPGVRGLLGASFQLFVVIGVLIITCLGSFISWKWSAIASSAAVVISLAILCVMPESPRWLVVKGKYQEAISAVTFLQGPTFDAAAECVAINEDICHQPKGQLTFKEFLKPSVFKPGLLAIGLVFFQQATGSNAVLFYTVNIFKENKTGINPNVESIILDIVLVVATAVSSGLMDKAGRKMLLMISSVVMGISLALLGGYEIAKKSHHSLESDYSWVPLVCLTVYIAAFSLGFGPIPWLMMAEMSPVRVRSIICGVATTLCWIFVFVVTKTFEGLKESIHDYGAYWVYSGFCALACIFIIFFLPETKGKSFEEIQDYFGE